VSWKVNAATLSSWREVFLANGLAGLKSREVESRDEKNTTAEGAGSQRNPNAWAAATLHSRRYRYPLASIQSEHRAGVTMGELGRSSATTAIRISCLKEISTPLPGTNNSLFFNRLIPNHRLNPRYPSIPRVDDRGRIINFILHLTAATS